MPINVECLKYLAKNIRKKRKRSFLTHFFDDLFCFCFDAGDCFGEETGAERFFDFISSISVSFSFTLSFSFSFSFPFLSFSFFSTTFDFGAGAGVALGAVS